MRNRIVKLILVLMVALIVFSGCAKEAENENQNQEEKVINIGKVPYPHEWISVHIIKNVAEQMGYQVDLIEGEVGFMFLGLAQGDIDIYPDIWMPTLHKTYMDKYKDKIELINVLTQRIELGWAIPEYVNINSIADLKGKGGEFDNRIVGIEPSSGLMLNSEEIMKVYNLEDEYTLMEGSTPAMLAAVEKATANKEPIAFLAWRPHTMFTQYDIKLLEDPKGVLVFDDINIGVNNGLKDKAPDLYNFLQRFSLSVAEFETILIEMEESDKNIEVLVEEWMKENRDRVDKMMGKD